MAAGRAALCVWNHGSWCVVSHTDIVDGKALFEKVGCGREFVLNVQVAAETDRLLRVAKDATVTLLENPPSAAPGEDAFLFEFDKSCPLGEFEPDREYTLLVHTASGWKEHETERAATGAIRFLAEPDRLYRLVADGMTARPFTVAAASHSDEMEVHKH